MALLEQLLMSAGGTVTAGAVVVAVLSLLQVSKIQINPWSSLRRWIGGKFNAEQIQRIETLEKAVKELRGRLDEYIELDNRRTADELRRKILAFDNQLLRGIPHTLESFEDIANTVSEYEQYCDVHPKYKNHLATHAIAHIDKVFEERKEKRDFLTE